MAALRQARKLLPALLSAASRSTGCGSLATCGAQALASAPALDTLAASVSSSLALQWRSLHSSCGVQGEAPAATAEGPVKLYEPGRKFRPLADKELWHEAWMYEDRFGTEDNPIFVPSLEDERIIGVTDPEDDNLVVWGILKAGEPARQLIEGGEYYVLKVVPYVAKVGDILEQLEAEGASGGAPLAAN